MADLSQFAKAYFILYSGDIKTVLSSIGLDNLIILNNKNAILYTPIDFDDNLLNTIREVNLWRTSLPMSPLGIITNQLNQGVYPTTGIGSSEIIQSAYLNLTGNGVVIAIIDSGIDYTHPDFIFPDGTSKILRIWDQENQNGIPPQGYLFGTEYTNSEINIAIANNDISLTIDARGTGTMAAGMAAGRGRQYMGIAPGARLLLVKLREYENLYYNESINYKTMDYLAAVDYAFKVASELNLPLVINGTVDFRGGSYGTETLLESLRFSNQKGKVIVHGAGNDGNTDTHYSGKFTQTGEIQDILIKVGEKDKNLDIYVIAQRPDIISISIITPGGEITPKIDYRESISYSGRFNVEDVDYTVSYLYPEFVTGDLYGNIRLVNIKPGVWTIRLYGDYIVSGIHDLYLPVRGLIDPHTRFLKPDPFETISTYAADKGLITIGAYNIITDSMWIGSSSGPVPIDDIKPDIVASGVNVIGSFPGGIYNTMTGTAASSSIVSGVVALLLEYFFVDGVSIESAYTEVIKTYLMAGAATKDIYDYPNVLQGYGVLNIVGTFRQIAKVL